MPPAAPQDQSQPRAARDDVLIARIQAGDPRAFELLHERYHRLALHIARRVLGGNQGAAEDVVQEAFLSLWRRSELFDARRGSLRTWLAGLVRHRAIDALRREHAEQHRRTRAEQLSPRESETESTAALMESSERAHTLRCAVERLPREQYRVMDLAYYLEISQSAIADLLRSPLGTIKGRSRLGLAKLRDGAADQEDEHAPGSAQQELLVVAHERDGDAHLIVARGEIDLTTAPLLSSALQAALDQGGGRVVVDMSQISFIDSAGLSVLLNALRRLTRQGRTLAIACHEHGSVHKLLAILELVGTLSLHRTRKSALENGDDIIEPRSR